MPKGSGEERVLKRAWFAELGEALDQPCLVQGLLLERGLSVIYGETNSGKTFFVLDLALAIAQGAPWCGRRTRQGLVVYVAGEGAVSVQNRVTAYRLRHPEVAPGIPFAVVLETVNLLDPASVNAFIVGIRALEAECGVRCSVIVIDTLARALAGADENSFEDMSLAVSSADRIRAFTGAALCYIHHTGKDTARGPRGHSSLLAAVDTEILIEGQSGVRTAVAIKQRDLPSSGEKIAFELTPIDIGVTDEGDPISSCTVTYTAIPEAGLPGDMKYAGKNQEKVLAVLKEWSRANPGTKHITSMEIKNLLAHQGVSRQRRYEVLERFVAVRILTPSVGGYTLDPTMF